MTPALLALTLALADPFGFPSPSPVAPAAAAPAPVAAPRPPAAPLTLPTSAGATLDALILPVAALLALAVAALLATRRKKQGSRLIQVLETTGLGPKRALVVARVGDELLVIGSSEAGLQLLAARPAGLEPRPLEAPTRLQAVPDEDAAEAGLGRHPVLDLLGRLRRRPAAGRGADPLAPPAFDSLLAESAEDQELRRKLALGQAGSVR
jgi:flagellar biogenesis protein FliO